MKKFLLFFIALLLLAFTASSQVPDSHPANGMRKYYADVYTGQSIIAFESQTLDSILFVVSQFIEPAQVISVYSYKSNPYKHRQIYASEINHVDKRPQKDSPKGYHPYSVGFALLPDSNGMPKLYPTENYIRCR